MIASRRLLLRTYSTSRALIYSQSRYHQDNGHQESSSSSWRFFGIPISGLSLATVAIAAHAPEEKSSADEGISKKDQQTINYQNRIRKFSTPDKVFRLFATIKVLPKDENSKKKGQVFMTPDDFVRSITPGSMQPPELDLDKFNKIQDAHIQDFLKKISSSSKGKDNNIFDEITKGGLISFNDYIFLLTVLSTSARHWRILFKVFDQNGDGDVDIDEFMTVMKLAQSSSATGEKHRDTGENKAKSDKKSAVIKYFFKNKEDTLTLEAFEEFYNQLRRDILKIQFDKENPDSNGKINLMSVCKMLLAYIERIDVSSAAQLARCKKVLYELGYKPLKRSEGVSFEEIEGLFNFLSCIEDIEMALDMHTSANVELNKKEFTHVSYVVANHKLDQKLVDAVYAVFDEDGSGGLSHNEFLKTIKSRASFGLDRPKDTGLWRFFGSVFSCGKENFKNMFKMK